MPRDEALRWAAAEQRARVGTPRPVRPMTVGEALAHVLVAAVALAVAVLMGGVLPEPSRTTSILVHLGYFLAMIAIWVTDAIRGVRRGWFVDAWRGVMTPLTVRSRRAVLGAVVGRGRVPEGRQVVAVAAAREHAGTTSWQIALFTGMVMVQAGFALPDFPFGAWRWAYVALAALFVGLTAYFAVRLRRIGAFLARRG